MKQTKSPAGDRIEYLDYLRGFAMLCVVTVHTRYIGEHANAWISTFMMPTFMVVSGFLISYKEMVAKKPDVSFSSVLYKRFKGIMIPYFAFGLVITVLDLIQLLRGRLTGTEVLVYFLDFILLRGRGALWFLPAIFLGEIPARLLKKLPGIASTLLSLGITLAAAFLAGPVNSLCEVATESIALLSLAGILHTIVRALYLCVFFRLGELLGEWLIPLRIKAREKHKEVQYRLIISICGTIILAGLWFLSDSHGVIDIHFLTLGEPASSVALTILGGMGIFLLFSSIPVFPPFKQLLSFWGVNSLIIMATHVEFYLLLIGTKIVNILDSRFSFMNNYLDSAFLMIFFIIVEIPVCLVIRKFFPFMLGKPYPKKETTA